jgi:hypothetical protein
MNKNEEPLFGFNCGTFNVELLAPDLVVPRAKTSRLTPAMNPTVRLPKTGAPFTFRATHRGKIICDVPVTARWDDDAGSGIFLALRTPDAPRSSPAFRPTPARK